jgi:5'-deoxynucleotidase YfbR-like HD superfamily hydrolase
MTKDDVFLIRTETASEHTNSTIYLCDYLIYAEPEFSNLDRLHVHDLLSVHDVPEIITTDIGISEREKREKKEEMELEAIPILYNMMPNGLNKRFLECIEEYRLNITLEARFANGVDKMDSLVHELQYPLDWGPKGFDEKNVREWFQPSFEYSPTFMRYFEFTVQYLKNQGYFNV